MFKAITLAAALTLGEAAQNPFQWDHDTRPVQTNPGCDEADVDGEWTWNGGDYDGETLDIEVYGWSDEDASGNAQWDFRC